MAHVINIEASDARGLRRTTFAKLKVDGPRVKLGTRYPDGPTDFTVELSADSARLVGSALLTAAADLDLRAHNHPPDENGSGTAPGAADARADTTSSGTSGCPTSPASTCSARTARSSSGGSATSTSAWGSTAAAIPRS